VLRKHRQPKEFTAEPHLTTRCQDCFQHLADIDVPKLPANTVSTHTILDDRHDSE